MVSDLKFVLAERCEIYLCVFVCVCEVTHLFDVSPMYVALAGSCGAKVTGE